MTTTLPTVVCVHGLLGFDVLVVGPFALAKYFRVAAPWLRARGYKVLTPEVPPTGSIERRAERLRTFLLRECPHDRIAILAHSMGGLDSRYLLTHCGDGLNITSLTTLVTPHRGSAIASSLLSATERYNVLPIFDRMNIDLGGLHDLQPAVCEEFNLKTPDRPDVKYYSIVAHRPRADIRMSLRLTCGHLEKISGLNDGLVTTTSAQWGTCIGEWNLDHMEILGHGRVGAAGKALMQTLDDMMEKIRFGLV